MNILNDIHQIKVNSIWKSPSERLFLIGNISFRSHPEILDGSAVLISEYNVVELKVSADFNWRKADEIHALIDNGLLVKVESGRIILEPINELKSLSD